MSLKIMRSINKVICDSWTLVKPQIKETKLHEMCNLLENCCYIFTYFASCTPLSSSLSVLRTKQTKSDPLIQ